MRTTINMMPSGVRFFFSRIFPWPFIIAGAILLCIGLLGVLRATASAAWPTAQGEIVSSSVESRSSGGRTGGWTYHAEILYDFNVEGMKYSGTRMAYGDYGSSDSSLARNIVHRYPKGKQVSVRYMPDNPEVCVLEPGVKAQTWFLAGFGLIFFGLGSAMAVLLPKLFANTGPITEQQLAADSDDAAAKP